MVDWHRMFETVYWGVAYGSLQALKHFRTTGRSGAIISAGSFFGDRTPLVQSTYLAKFAVHGFTATFRQVIEHDRIPVSVSLIHPTQIDTPYNEHAGNYMPMQPVRAEWFIPRKESPMRSSDVPRIKSAACSLAAKLSLPLFWGGSHHGWSIGSWN
jgi:NAD(P)-dependent dehydrogenase (short-subunit alcohol dehydrogenase family)